MRSDVTQVGSSSLSWLHNLSRAWQPKRKIQISSFS